MFSTKNKLLKKLAVLFLFLLFVFVFLFVWVITVRNQNYDPVETLKVEEATVRVYFSPEVDYSQSDWYQGRTPDPEKHRIVEYTLILKNTGHKKKSFVIADVDPVLNLSFTKLIINDGGDIPAPLTPNFGCKIKLGCGLGKGLYYLTEGDPVEIKKFASQSKIRILWEEGGKKWEKITPVNLVEFPEDYYRKEDRYEDGKTLKIIEAYAYVNFSSEPNSPIFDWYKGRQPDPKRHRNVSYYVDVRNIGKDNKRFVLLEPILDPSFQKLIINSYVSDIPMMLLMPVENPCLSGGVYLTEGDPAEIEKLASKTKIRILWEEGGKKWEKIVPITSVKVLPAVAE